jgi:general nucleoside transport system permease protein
VFIGLVAYGWSPFLGIPAAILAGALFGAAWGSIPGLLKAYLNINEIITTIMMNYIGIQIVGWLVHGPLLEPPGNFPESAMLAQSVWYPRLFGTRVHFGFVVAVGVALLAYFILFHTPLGFKMRAVGFNRDAAEYAGINIKRYILFSMLLSGAAAGLAGVNEILGTTSLHRPQPSR